MVVNFLSRELAFDALDTMMYLKGVGGSEEVYYRFVSALEEGLGRIEKEDMPPISEKVIYDAMDIAYPFIAGYSDFMRFAMAKDIPNRLRDHLKYNEFEDEEINNLASFCKAFHDIALNRRSENIPRVEEMLGKLE